MPVIGRLNIVVTGGAGFIGSHLCDRLVQKGHAVTCVDNLYTGRFENIRPLLNHRNFRFVEGDVREPLAVDGPVDRIYNLACPASPPHYQRDPIGTVKTCVLGALHALELARSTGARVLQASTSEVYGDPEIHPQPESYRGSVNTTGPRACYDEGKRCAEALFFDYRRMYGVPVKVARIFNTYGPRMLENDGRVISNFVVQALRNRPITLYGDGSQTRSFCYVEDLLNGLELLMESDDAVTGPFNLGNPREVTVKEIARMVLEQTGSRSRLAYHPLPQDDPRRRKPEIAAAAQALGWQPRVPLEDGLRSTIDYFALKVATPEVPRPAEKADAVVLANRPPRKRRTALSAVAGQA
ncbi:UDP-glucuronic acid decarboxylase family protein [Rhodoplanes roseus]|uniref:NAD-dependent dehydratase n=1 Tax=Rhodoplanes roseus TaxID=29409 RepID=A0A327KT22_9BRAD|nr:UDP-glucuronic acid decarboxylase family protein [Rhodoplanes roseus]RAI40472.1 NAD-dependent dehydratase [Rhodoplanes roseus]